MLDPETIAPRSMDPGTAPAAPGDDGPGRRPFRILCLDGGGIMGAFAASILARYEERLGEERERNGLPPIAIADHFDLITGTSTGGIIALGLGMGASAAAILGIYRDQGPAIFPQPKGWFGRRLASVRRLFNAKLSPAPLREAVEGIAGGRTMADAWPRLVIPAYGATGDGHVYVFKTPHDPPGDRRDAGVPIVDVALATGAAPTYLRAHEIPGQGVFIDGGVWANCPVSVGVVEAVAFCGRRMEDLRVLSLSTTNYPFSLGKELLRGGILPWVTRVSEMFMFTQVQKEVALARCLLGDRFHRIDYNGVPGRYTMDDSSSVAELIALGRRVADLREHSTVVFRDFLNGVAAGPIPGLARHPAADLRAGG
ncbi:MAG TPA: CBASS cGAMP-activated phospholipase [Isosphaeraceae bacterium]